jgi:hypothetical protein
VSRPLGQRLARLEAVARDSCGCSRHELAIGIRRSRADCWIELRIVPSRRREDLEGGG